MVQVGGPYVTPGKRQLVSAVLKEKHTPYCELKLVIIAYDTAGTVRYGTQIFNLHSNNDR